MSNNLAMWSALVGALLPALVAFVNREHWPAWAKGLTAVASSVVAGGVTAWLSDGFTGKTWLQSALIVVGAALASYRLWWHPTGVAPAIERAT
jgi:VIT1/CCC1 family predicted Fe2+/Mn2+ transporter